MRIGLPSTKTISAAAHKVGQNIRQAGTYVREHHPTGRQAGVGAGIAASVALFFVGCERIVNHEIPTICSTVVAAGEQAAGKVLKPELAALLPKDAQISAVTFEAETSLPRHAVDVKEGCLGSEVDNKGVKVRVEGGISDPEGFEEYRRNGVLYTGPDREHYYDPVNGYVGSLTRGHAPNGDVTSQRLSYNANPFGISDPGPSYPHQPCSRALTLTTTEPISPGTVFNDQSVRLPDGKAADATQVRIAFTYPVPEAYSDGPAWKNCVGTVSTRHPDGTLSDARGTTGTSDQQGPHHSTRIFANRTAPAMVQNGALVPS